jgi:ribosome-associated toxin RatA of RatAB toxin-antitoxin module
MPTITRSVLVEVPVSKAYAAVTDVECYPEFLPGCRAVTVEQRDDDRVRAKVSVSGMGRHETFTTNNVLRSDSVTMELEDGPFEYLRGEWQFSAIGDSGCRVSVQLEYKPKGVLARLLSGMAPAIADKVVDAFVTRMGEL